MSPVKKTLTNPARGELVEPRPLTGSARTEINQTFLKRASKRLGRGDTLIEVLVALVVFSIGLLGLAQLQMAGLRNATSAATRLEAVNLSYDILERMRANRTPAVAGSYDVAIGGASSAGGIAQEDVEAWKAALAAGLPGGDGSVEVDDRIATITVQWSESWDADLADGLATVRLRTQL